MRLGIYQFYIYRVVQKERMFFLNNRNFVYFQYKKIMLNQNNL